MKALLFLFAAPAISGPFLAGWSPRTVISRVDGVPLRLDARGPQNTLATTLYVGGLATSESLRPLADARVGESQAYLKLRGHPPSGWKRGTAVLNADARDLAEALSATVGHFRAKRVSLVLHSYAGLAFQRMVQLNDDPRVAEALKLLSGTRVALVATASRRDGEPFSWGSDYETGSSVLRGVANAVDIGDAQARWNPAGTVIWENTRATLIAEAVRPGVERLHEALEGGWKSGPPGVREELESLQADNIKRPEWNEGILRRSLAVGHLDFRPEDAQRLRDRGIGALVLVADADQVLPWFVSRILLKALDIPAPERAPVAGTKLCDASGSFAARVLTGDHYLPVKDPAGLAAELSR